MVIFVKMFQVGGVGRNLMVMLLPAGPKNPKSRNNPNPQDNMLAPEISTLYETESNDDVETEQVAR